MWCNNVNNKNENDNNSIYIKIPIKETNKLINLFYIFRYIYN